MIPIPNYCRQYISLRTNENNKSDRETRLTKIINTKSQCGLYRLPVLPANHQPGDKCAIHLSTNWPADSTCRFQTTWGHYNDVIMSAMASQITSLTIVYSTVYPGADQRKHQSSASLAFVRGIHRWPVNSPHKRPATDKITAPSYKGYTLLDTVEEYFVIMAQIT